MKYFTPLSQSQKLQDVEHRSARDTQSRQELESLRRQSLEQLQEDVEDRESQLRALSAQLEKNSKETELWQQRNHKQIKHVSLNCKLYDDFTISIKQ